MLNKTSSIILASISIASLALTLTSCMVGPDFKSPCPPEVETYTETPLPHKTVTAPVKGGNAQTFAIAKRIPKDWWTLFHSSALNCLIERGIANSPNLEAAEAALLQSQKLMIAYFGSTFFPAINGTGNAQRERQSEAFLGFNNIPATIFNFYSATVNVSYTLDAFGAGRRGLEALIAQVEYQAYLVDAAYLTLTSNIVSTAITEASYRAQIQATCELIDLNEKQLKIIRQQFTLGGASEADILAQETLLAQTKATLPPLQKNLSVARHALAALVGRFPSNACLPSFYLDALTLPKELPVSLPSTLVRQRPDIRASEALLHKASANVGVATANLFPQITLSGSYGNQTDTLSQLFTSPSRAWSFGGQILQPIFQGGSLIANREAAIAAYEQAYAQYRQTVVTAFQNVADSLRALEKDAETLKEQVAAEEAAKKTLILTQQQYQLGAVNFLQLLNAERQYELSHINRIQAQAARYSDTAALFQSLGGGWWCGCG